MQHAPKQQSLGGNRTTNKQQMILYMPSCLVFTYTHTHWFDSNWPQLVLFVSFSQSNSIFKLIIYRSKRIRCNMAFLRRLLVQSSVLVATTNKPKQLVLARCIANTAVNNESENWLSKLLMVRKIDTGKEAHSRLLSDTDKVYELHSK